jgi:ferredoxin/flavodoxin---NADP+ reductase
MNQTDSAFRVAVLGSGPAGIYTAAALLAGEHKVSVDVIDRLPAPYGLVRYGVAPDHIKIKSVVQTLRKPFTSGGAHFIGNVSVGDDEGVSLERVRKHYHAVVIATGSSVDRDLGIDGEDLQASLGSREFVGWYCGHPDFADTSPPLDHPGVAVVGAGNVALDVVRMLAMPDHELAPTDVPDGVLNTLAGSQVRDIHLLIRREPSMVRFTPSELRQIGELSNVDMIVHSETPIPDAAKLEDRRQRQNVELVAGWASNPPSSAAHRRIHLWFQRRPSRILGRDGRVSALVTERTDVAAGDVGVIRAEQTLDVGLVVRAIGYKARQVPGLPFDHATGTIPNRHGRVIGDRASLAGLYVAGWIKRGPTGVIGTNKADAAETAAAVLEDLPALTSPPQPEREQLLAALHARGLCPTGWAEWLRLDAAEQRLGHARGGAERVKVSRLSEMLAACASL